MDLSSVTPLILTYNEAPNIRRTLERLSWAKTMLIVDSFSTDETVPIINEFPQAKVIQREFDNHTDQNNFGLDNVTTKWTLSLDADYVCPPTLAEEIERLDGNCDGYSVDFRYCVFAKPIRGTLYPPRIVLYQTALARFQQDGHTQRVSLSGPIGKLISVIDHDDRKPHQRWLRSQANYAALEADKLLRSCYAELSWKDRLRLRLLIAPVLMVFYCLFAKRLILDGWPGIYYTLQRVYAELLLSLDLLDRRLRPEDDRDLVHR